MTNGARALIETLVGAGVDTVFTNPGTSEMHFVAALDDVPQMRPVLTLFEGVASGAADGFARMAERPAATLLHLGPGLGNALANLHNARRARVPVVNIVGDHATSHTRYDAQLQSDIETVARNVSSWVRTSSATADLAMDATEAIRAASARPPAVATLILPADVSWGDGAEPAVVPEAPEPTAQQPEILESISAALRSGEPCALLLGGDALRGTALVDASRVSEATGVRLLAEVFPTRMERGAGVPAVERLAYFAEMASVQLAGLRHLILVDSREPVSFFAYPGKKSYLVPDGCTVHRLVPDGGDTGQALSALVAVLGAEDIGPRLQEAVTPTPPKGTLTAEKVCRAIAATLPPDTIISDESQTSGVMLPSMTAGAPQHDLLTLTGGAIGQGLPVAIGAAIACPDRPVLALEADGSAMYTIQSLWTMARESLNVTIVLFNNRSYGILQVELQRVGAATAGSAAPTQLEIGDPDLDFVGMARAMGVAARRADSGEDLTAALREAYGDDGPHLIEVVIPPALSGLRLKALPHALGVMDKLPRPLGRALKRRLAP